MTRHFLALVLALLSQEALARPEDMKVPQVKVHGRLISGLHKDGVDEFLGVPYGAPPVGELRWRPPQPAAENKEPLQATRFAGICAQSNRGGFTRHSINEDCLNLNVFAPGNTARDKAVMVWFYGGGLFSGESDDYDGSRLAGQGDVIVVTVNYRVGALGFLSHPALNNEGHAFANYGIMDQQLALRWVHDNISTFGGNPRNVTIFGQSGGGTSVMAHLLSPLSKGLFAKAINQSGTHVEVVTPQRALEVGKDFASKVGCASQSADCLRKVSVENIISHQNEVVKYVSSFPVEDGRVITGTAMASFLEGKYNHVPMINGLVQDEQAWFMPEGKTGVPLDAASYNKFVQTLGVDDPRSLLLRYPLSKYASPSLAEVDLVQEAKRCTARQLDIAWSKYDKVYAYEFQDRSAPWYLASRSYPMRAYHSAELQYIFPLFHGASGISHELTASQKSLSREMVEYWTEFAQTGVPLSRGNVKWDGYNPHKDDVLLLGPSSSRMVMPYVAEQLCKVWASISAAKFTPNQQTSH